MLFAFRIIGCIALIYLHEVVKILNILSKARGPD